jgi:hypothetical protein
LLSGSSDEVIFKKSIDPFPVISRVVAGESVKPSTKCDPIIFGRGYIQCFGLLILDAAAEKLSRNLGSDDS